MKLVYLNGRLKDRGIALRPPGICLGRADDNDVCLDDPQISQYHAKVEQENDVWYVRDLDSTNGVQLNGTRVKGREPLSIRDEIKLGGTSFLFADDDFVAEPTASPSEATSEGEANTGLSAQQKRILVMVATLLVVCIVFLASLVLQGNTASPKPQLDQKVNNRLRVHYEKTEASNKAIFRYSLNIQDNNVTVVVDDLKNERRFTDNKQVDDLDALKKALLSPAFLELESPSPKENDRFQVVHRLLIQSGRIGNHVTVVNDVLPPAFVDATSALEAFAKLEFGLAAMAISRDEIIAKAREKFEFAEQFYEERSVEASNLHMSVEAYRYVVEYLKDLDNKPLFYERAHERHAVALKELEDKLRKLEFTAQMHMRMGELTDARAMYQEVIRMVPTRDNPYVQRARKEVAQIGRKLSDKQRKR